MFSSSTQQLWWQLPGHPENENVVFRWSASHFCICDKHACQCVIIAARLPQMLHVRDSRYKCVGFAKSTPQIPHERHNATGASYLPHAPTTATCSPNLPQWRGIWRLCRYSICIKWAILVHLFAVAFDQWAKPFWTVSQYRGHHFLPLRHEDSSFSKAIPRPFITNRHWS